MFNSSMSGTEYNKNRCAQTYAYTMLMQGLKYMTKTVWTARYILKNWWKKYINFSVLTF